MAAHCLPQYGSLAVPTVLDALNAPDVAVRRRGLIPAGEISDPQFVAPVLKMMEDKDPGARKGACYASQNNWNERFMEPLMRRLCDSDRGVASAAQYCMRQHIRDVTLDSGSLRKMLAEDSPASLVALQVLQTRGEISRADLVRLFSSTNLSVVSSGFTPLRYKLQVEELTPLMTNSLPMARLMALGVLTRMADKPAVERIVSMLHDPNEVVRWRVRSAFRRLTGQKLGADPAAYEKWWAENKDTYVPIVAQSRSGNF
jgi:HEAT repeat protein